jgi:hypothetical protein
MPAVTVENVVCFQEAVGVFVSVHSFGSLDRLFVGARAAETTDDRGRFDDESR